MQPADPLIGRLLEGRYRIQERIARGGMSTVYAAVDERLARPVAVKIMASGLSADPVFLDRFVREARAAARLSHVNAVAVYDQGRDRVAGADHVFLVMELVHGRTLRALIRERRGRFAPAEAVSLMEPVLSALSGAHRAGLVHRDVKPENVLLGDDGIVKVADFGLARAIDGDSTAASTGLMMGTVSYSAPEQIVDGRADPRADVYSAGVVLFELLTGRPPFEGDSAMAVAYQHVHARVPAPSQRVRGIPAPIDRLVLSATAREPARRPGDAAALLAQVADVRTELRLPIVPVPQRREAGQRTAAAHPRRAAAPPRSHTTSPLASPAADTEWLPAHHSAGVGLLDTAVAPVGARTRTTAGRDTARERPPAVAGGLRKGPPGPPELGTPHPRPSRRHRRRRFVALVVLLLLGIGAVYGGWQATRWFQRWNSHVPGVSGRSLPDARTLLQHAGYRMGHESWAYSETVHAGLIISTDPGAGSRAARGTAVDLTLSRGRQRIAVPTVRALPRLRACAVLQEHGLACSATARSRPSARVKRGGVVATDPRSGSLVLPHASVTLVVSAGPPLVAVPQLPPGTPWVRAAAALRGAHLVPQRVLVYDDTVPAGGVVSVPSGTVRYGSTVRVVVSRGPQLVTIPSFDRGTPVDAVSSRLQALGLHPVVRQVAYGMGLGWFLDTSPGAGTAVPLGSSVIVDSF